MPRNNLKRLPVAFIRRGMAHFHPGCPTPDRRPPEGPVPAWDPDPRRPVAVPESPPSADSKAA